MASGHICSSYQSDPDFEELLVEFVQGVPDRVQAIRDAQRENRSAVLSTLVHQLRGACGSYGFHEMTPSAASLDEDLRAGISLDALGTRIDAFIDDCLRMTAGSEDGPVTN